MFAQIMRCLSEQHHMSFDSSSIKQKYDSEAGCALCKKFLTKYLLYEPHEYKANCVERFIGRINWF
jgi:hypothetical protein